MFYSYKYVTIYDIQIIKYIFYVLNLYSILMHIIPHPLCAGIYVLEFHKLIHTLCAGIFICFLLLEFFFNFVAGILI
ncbi:hypothetical protein ZOSMA_27G01310 [Zostera marina]|uniref:Uncharacterized protein n=1 Tax=Zostera marina TaxID=29655 RepID=A0A0K9PFR3_ZOSMR|nr:hypothetical protein ZOSMA_27G01310 [Zostera marina]